MNYNLSRQTISVEVINPNNNWTNHDVTVEGKIVEENITFTKKIRLNRGKQTEVVFTPEDHPQLIIKEPRLWWPINKGDQPLYNLT